MPKLTNETPDDTQRKKGVADEELAKKEAERARKRELEERDEELIRQTEVDRRRSESVDSVSTISTNRSTSPPPRQRSPSPMLSHRRQKSPEQKGSGRRSFSPASDDDRSNSKRSARRRQAQSPLRRRQRSLSRDSRSPVIHEKRYRERDEDYPKSTDRPAQEHFRGRDSSGSRASSLSRGVDTHNSRKSLSRSPDRQISDFEGHSRGGDRGPAYSGHPGGRFERGGRTGKPERRSEQRQPQRERSLSPFSKRLALTQSMNMGR